jgi:hypothetical protein
MARGRVSAASLAVVPTVVEPYERASPPAELDDEQAGMWREIVSGLAPDWFRRENFPLLVQYVRAISRGRRLAELISGLERSPSFDVQKYQSLIRSEQEISKTLVGLAVRMRFAQSTSFDKSKRKPPSTAAPWQP